MHYKYTLNYAVLAMGASKNSAHPTFMLYICITFIVSLSGTLEVSIHCHLLLLYSRLLLEQLSIGMLAVLKLDLRRHYPIQ